MPAAARSYTDVADGSFRYAVSAVTAAGVSLPSVPCTCEAGNADHTPPHAVVVSPPTSVVCRATGVAYRSRTGWTSLGANVSDTVLSRAGSANLAEDTHGAARVKAVFAAEIPAGSISDRGVEYYVNSATATT